MCHGPLRMTRMLITLVALSALCHPQSQESTTSPSTTTQQPAPGETGKPQSQEADKPSPSPSDMSNGEMSNSGDENKAAAPQTRKRNGRKPQASFTGEPRRTVIRHGGTRETRTQIIPGMSPEEANRIQLETGELVSAANIDLNQLASRTLTANQQETVVQIHHYLDVAQSAFQEGDIQRAHTLAFKAHLLSDDLVKH